MGTPRVASVGTATWGAAAGPATSISGVDGTRAGAVSGVGNGRGTGRRCAGSGTAAAVTSNSANVTLRALLYLTVVL